MTDHDVDREVEANLQRDVEGEENARDDGPVVDAAERVVDPLVNLIDVDGADEDDVDEQRELNDAEQRRDE
jgi:hypothetical protein